MMKTALSLALLSILGAGVASAAERGAYIGGGAGVVSSDVAKNYGESFYSAVSSKDESDTGFKFYGGYSWGQWGVEAGYYDLGTFKAEGRQGSVSVADQFRVNAFGVSAVGNFALDRMWSLNAKLGLASATSKYHCVTACSVRSDHDTNSVVPLAGFGVSLKVSPSVALRADWEGFGNITSNDGVGSGDGKHNYNLFTISGQIHF